MEQTAREVLEFTFPETYVGHKTYREPPYHIRDEFIKHVKETYQPETYPGLYWGRLRGNEPFEIIQGFAVDRKKRPNGEYIPCPMCGKREKFLEGSLVYIFARQCVAIIGHDCASAEVKHAAFSKKRKDDERRQHEDFLMARLVKVPEMLRELEAMKRIATELERIFHKFKREAPTIHKALRQIRKSGGDYVLTEMVDNQAVDFDPRLPKKVARNAYFGILRGDAMVAAKCTFLTDVRRYEQWLLSFDGCDDEEKAMEATIGLLERNEAVTAVKYIGEAGRQLPKLKQAMSEACSFFSDTHVADLREWAGDRLQPHTFTVERHVRNHGISLIISRATSKEEEREYCHLLLSQTIAEWADASGRRANIGQ